MDKSSFSVPNVITKLKVLRMRMRQADKMTKNFLFLWLRSEKCRFVKVKLENRCSFDNDAYLETNRLTDFLHSAFLCANLSPCDVKTMHLSQQKKKTV